MTLADALRSRDLDQLPSRRAEAWRYSDLRSAVGALPAPSPESEAFGHSPFADIPGETITVLNGRRLDDLDDLDSTSRVQLGAGLEALDCLHVRFVSNATATGHAAQIAITVAAGRRALMLESYEGRGSAYVSDVRLDIHLGEGATLERVVIAEELADAVSVSTCHVAIEGGATFHQTVLSSGARLQRLETHVRHPGAEASVRIDGLYLLGERRHADLTSVVTHEGEGGTTSQLTKGVVADQARGVFQGRITVLQGADRTDARMGHHALLLSDRAEVDAKPELEIWADDVSCAHGNTVGALDEEALFYARSRGIPEAGARALLTEAFLGEVVERIDHLRTREVVRAWVERRLRGLG